MSLAQQIKKSGHPKQGLKKYTPPPLHEDPRPDLEGDHYLWERFLKLACNLPDEKEAFELVKVLNGMRCAGTRMVKGRASYILRPLIDEQKGWGSQEEYEEMRDKYLKPYSDKVKVLLKLLTDEMPGGDVS